MTLEGLLLRLETLRAGGHGGATVVLDDPKTGLLWDVRAVRMAEDGRVVLDCWGD